MDTLKVKVRDDIVNRGSGFFDITGKQRIFAKKSDDIIEVQETPFVREKIATGELIVISRRSGVSNFEIRVNDKMIKTIPIDASMSEKDILELVYSDKVVIKAIGNKDIVAVEKTDSSISIRTE